jgi:hypothetical protein
VVNADAIDLVRLRKLALSKFGLVSQEMRRVAWPLLMGLSIADTEEDYTGMSSPGVTVIMMVHVAHVQQHAEWNQVEVDVARSLWKWPPGTHVVAMTIASCLPIRLQGQSAQRAPRAAVRHHPRHSVLRPRAALLSGMTTHVCRDAVTIGPQGFHDIVGMMLLIVGDRAAYAMSSRVVVAHFRYPIAAVID